MSAGASIEPFADASTAQIPRLSSAQVTLTIRQQPESARVAVGKEKDRKPVDPPPIVQLMVSQAHVSSVNFLHNPFIVMSVLLVPAETAEGSTPPNPGAALAGTLVSSLHRLKDTDNEDAAFFIFGDLSVKMEGRFQLRFNLHEIRHGQCFNIKTIVSDVFTVHATRHFPGMAESTFLTRSCSDQGVRLRLRKEPRTLLRKRGPASEDYVPRHYNKTGGGGGGRSNQDDPSATGESSQQRQGEPAPSGIPMQSPSLGQRPTSVLPMQPPSLDRRPSVARGYSYQSADSYSPTFSGEPTMKRPRTGSGHQPPQIFGQYPSPESQPYLLGMFPDPQQQSPYDSVQPSQTPNFGSFYTPSPHPASPTRDAAYARFPIPGASYSAMPPQRSLQSFYPPQQQTIQSPQQYGMPQMDVPDIVQRMHTSLAMGGTSMVAPLVYGRMEPTPFGSLTSTMEDRRERYDGVFQSPGANLSLGMGAATPYIPSTSSGPVTTTSGPGMNPY